MHEHTSGSWQEARSLSGVRYRIARLSLGRRIELARRIREIGRKVEFLAGGGDPREKLAAAVLAGEIERAYLEWGLLEVDGLAIDGEPASPESLIEKGPMELAAEIVERIKAECGLSESERKN